ncbi:YjbH domain-containing protein [Amaricoccus sp. W119]|uniref:YjbH domain-containing protein n=1 Tax=Amaricoccus sp. W119 TaxID=3391833 RepID=UPI0039A57C71
MSDWRPRAGMATAALASVSALALGFMATAEEAPRPRPSVNLYGNPGLIDMPSAEMMPDGQMTLSWSRFDGMSRRQFNFQVLPWLTGSLRYSTIENWGRPDIPDYDLWDRSFDFRLRLLEDKGPWQPSLSLGFRDFLGTGVYSGEYLVASKRIVPDVTVTAGVGWGRFAGVNGFKNPFCSFSDGMCERDEDYGEGGKPAFGRFFRGEDAAFFGGVEWRTPYDGLTLKAEYSSDAYEREQEGPTSHFERKNPFNFGAEYRFTEGITVGGYYMYGDKLGFNIALSGNPNKPLTPQDLGVGPIPTTARPEGAPMGEGWQNDPAKRAQLSTALAEAMDTEGIRLERITFRGSEVDVLIQNRRYNQEPRAIGRATRVLQVGMPANVRVFNITSVAEGIETTTTTINRAEYERQIAGWDAGQRSWDTVGLAGAWSDPASYPVWTRPDLYPSFDWTVLPQPYLVLLTPGEPIRIGLNLDANVTLRVSQGLSFNLGVSQPLFGTYDDPGDSDSTLPHVRSNTSRYYSGKNLRMTNLTSDYVFKLNENTYGQVSAGYLERQFAGLYSEVLWKPVGQNWGLGAELAYVKQREWDAPLGLTDYDVVTGFGSVYWETGWYGMEVELDAGRYLAGDWGSTLTVTREFANGWAVGAYATLTDVTSEDYGEGSFDKGVMITIPFRWTVPFETDARNSIQLTSISRDGGAQLDVANDLWGTVKEFDRRHMQQNWGSFWQ